DTDLLDSGVSRREMRGGGESVVSLQLHHRPGGHAHLRNGPLEWMKLLPEGRFDPVARLVATPKLISERLDDMVGRDADVRGAGLQHLEYRAEHPEDSPHWRILPLIEPAGAIEVAKKLVRAVDEMDDHSVNW